MMILATGKNKGFTFVEILFVIIIIGILIGVFLPNFRRNFNSLQINNFSQELQAFINYLHQRSIIEVKIIYLNIDNEKKEYWAQLKDSARRLKTYHIPYEIKIETDQKEMRFYPDGSIDDVTIRLVNTDNQSITLTTKGIFGGVKVQPQ